ncbi:MAG: methylenetetrahydrofolate reductase [Planctomycetota bacterium]|nr:methylenetetrahydrofolate reductase [Planctomycetota bacterium]MDI6788072.1 methylenetetrahydrofolate reductase [Planctomycetota bacterium]
MSKLGEALKSGKFVITSEVGPPKGINMTSCLDEAKHFGEKVAAINVTDIQSAVMRVGSLATCIKLKERGYEPIMQMVCRDRNRLSLQSELLNAAVFGIENILCLTGDHQTLGDHPQAKGVFDLDSVQLIATAKGLMEGKDLAGNKLDGIPTFFLGGVVSPGLDPVELQIIKLEKKVRAGARFIQTQSVFESDKFRQFIDKVHSMGINIPILAGIIILKSVGMAKFMNENVAGVFVPDNLIKEMKETKDKQAKAVEIAARIIREVKPYCQGVHIMPLGWGHLVPEIIKQAGLSLTPM